MRYCGKRGGSSLEEMVRPEENDDPASDRKYRCPAGYKPCNDDFFERSTATEAGFEFVVCIPDDAKI